MAFTMLTRRRRFAVLLVLAAAIVLTVSTLIALGVRGPATAHAAMRHANKVQHAGKMPAVTARDGDTRQVGDQTSPDPAGGSAETGAGDPAGNGNAGGPDQGSPAGESSQEPEQGQPGEPAAGHADPSGSAGSDCTGNCVQ